jgi:nucleotide-binding universal stress UspA family protein
MGAETASGTQRTIAVGYDGTAPAEHALRRAADYARAFAAKVVVVSVAAPQPLAEVGAPGAFGLMPYYAYAAGDTGQVAERNEQLWEQHRERVQACRGRRAASGRADHRRHARTRLPRAAARRQRQPRRRASSALRRPGRPRRRLGPLHPFITGARVLGARSEMQSVHRRFPATQSGGAESPAGQRHVDATLRRCSQHGQQRMGALPVVGHGGQGSFVLWVCGGRSLCGMLERAKLVPRGRPALPRCADRVRRQDD